VSVISDTLYELVVAGSEDIIEGGRVTDGDAKVLSGTNNKRIFPADIVKGRTKLGATASGYTDSFLVVEVKTSSSSENPEDSFKGRKIRDEVGRTDRNVVSVQANVYVGGGSDHVV